MYALGSSTMYNIQFSTYVCVRNYQAMQAQFHQGEGLHAPFLRGYHSVLLRPVVNDYPGVPFLKHIGKEGKEKKRWERKKMGKNDGPNRRQLAQQICTGVV